MNENFGRTQLITELKDLVARAENSEDDTDIYCEFMKNIILNSYSVN